MDLEAFQALLTPAGQEALLLAQEREPREEDFLAHFQVLERSLPRMLARAALETTILRRKAQAKFPQAEKMYFTREALEQATSYDVARYRAWRYGAGSNWAYDRVGDLGCAIGGDSLALAEVTRVVGLEIDPLRVRLAQANLETLGLGEKATLIQADLRAALPFKPGMALFFDPARRAGGRRKFTVQQYDPPLVTIWEWLPDYPNLGVKVSPGVDLEELAEYPAEVEFISLKGELKEAALWFGALKTAERRATLLPGAHTLTEIPGAALPIREPQAYLYEPDPAVIRAGLVTTLGMRLGAAQMDAEIAYLTLERLLQTPFARAWQVADWFPFGLKRLRSYLRERGIGRVTVKKRGSPLEPEKLIHELRLRGDAEAVIFLTHLKGEPIVVIGRQSAIGSGQ
jgi:SAM-dependent methyltransferase